MKYIYYIFILYFLPLVLLPSMQSCVITDDICNSELPCDEDPCDNTSRTCSPFCGQAGCGIVIDEDNTQYILIDELPELEFVFVYLKNDHLKNISEIIWHPPKA